MAFWKLFRELFFNYNPEKKSGKFWLKGIIQMLKWHSSFLPVWHKKNKDLSLIFHFARLGWSKRTIPNESACACVSVLMLRAFPPEDIVVFCALLQQHQQQYISCPPPLTNQPWRWAWDVGWSTPCWVGQEGDNNGFANIVGVCSFLAKTSRNKSKN